MSILDRKGQINLEFLAAATLYIIALGTVMVSGSDILPTYTDRAQKDINLEARSFTHQVLTQKGHHEFGNEGSNWQKNSSTISNTDGFGLAKGFLEIDEDKLEKLSTVSFSSEKMNYSHMKELTQVDNQYRFRFTWMPTVDTNRSFVRGQPPSDPPINEPFGSSSNCCAPYNNSDNIVHYGTADLNGTRYNYLVTARNGVYNTTYINRDAASAWDFSTSNPYGENESITLAPYTIKKFQNLPDERGALLILDQHLKTFGARIDSESTVIKLQRFAKMYNEPVRVEVWAW